MFGKKHNKTLKIVFCNQKGGGGKSSSIYNLAVAAAKAGKRVGVIDTDSIQHTLTSAMKYAPDGLELYDPEKEYDMVFIDTAGNLTDPQLRQALLEVAASGGKIIVPTTTSSQDLESTAMTTKFIDQVAPEVPRALLFVRHQANQAICSEERREQAAEAFDWQKLDGVIKERAAVKRMLEQRLAMTKNDAEEYLAILEEIEELELDE